MTQADMTQAEIRQEIRTFLTAQIQQPALQDDEDIFAAGYVTSLFAMQLVLFLESQFNVQLNNQDLRLDHFRTITEMANLVERKQAA
ncbi:MAG: acyl carrier protein [Caldilinea sp.]|jgi:acyl carrier protein